MKFVQPLSTLGAGICLSMVIVAVANAENGPASEAIASTTVTGKVSEVKGEFHMGKTPQGEDTLRMVDKSYVITRQGGEEVRLELDRDTKVRNMVNPGDMIEAKISSKGHTISVTRLK